MTAHTPLPWHVLNNPRLGRGTSWRDIVTHSTEFSPSYVAEALEADAALIVTAVNNHQLLRAALSRYGHHDTTCPLREEANLPGDPRCTCGFSQALNQSNP